MSASAIDIAFRPVGPDRLERYNDLPMDFGDSALVRVAEREKLREVFALDKRDFSVYRPSHVKRLVIVPD